MGLKVLSWNTEGRLSPFSVRGRGTPQQILSEIQRHDADVVVLPEASDGDRISRATLGALDAMGYDVHTVYYDDAGARLHSAANRPTLKILSRQPVTNVTKTRYGDIRNGLYADITDTDDGVTYRLFGIHLDDRSENNRLQQVNDLTNDIIASPFPVIMMGDFNAMHGDDLQARLLRNVIVRKVGQFVPHSIMRDMLRRVSDMAMGTALQTIEVKTDLCDVDRRHRPTSTPKLRGQTWLPSIRLIQIDHLYVSPGIIVDEYKVARDGGSDHRAISAYVSYNSDKH